MRHRRQVFSPYQLWNQKKIYNIKCNKTHNKVTEVKMTQPLCKSVSDSNTKSWTECECEQCEWSNDERPVSRLAPSSFNASRPNTPVTTDLPFTIWPPGRIKNTNQKCISVIYIQQKEICTTNQLVLAFNAQKYSFNITKCFFKEFVKN